MEKRGKGRLKQSISGERFWQARSSKNYLVKELANKFGLTESAIQKWQQKGIPEKHLLSVAQIYGVEGWVFTSDKISEEDFTKIIFNPALMDKFRPDSEKKVSSEKPKNDQDHSLPKPKFSFSGKYDFLKGDTFTSKRFFINSGRLVIITKIWGIKESSVTTVQLNKFIDSYKGQNDDAHLIEIKTNTGKDQPYEQRDETQIDSEGIYYLKVRSTGNFEVKVYEVTW